jgi:thiol-disulfide isomerase/thioredoxin
MKHTLLFLAMWLTTIAALGIDVGDKAPALNGVKTWYNGETPNPGAGEAIHVVEFWATWCPPCRTTIPHLNELHKQFEDKGVIIAGISNETTDKVDPFMKKTEMLYRVGVDPDNSTAETYMKGVDGIPHAFVVNKEGIVVWQGHPMDGLDAVIAQVVDGTWNLEGARAAAEAGQATERLQQQVMEALQAGETDKTIELLDALMKADPADANIHLFKMQILTNAERGDEARQVGRDAVKTFHDKARQLNEIAWGILELAPTSRDLATALVAADRALELTERKDAAILDTAALAQYYLGNVEQAVALQKLAVEHSANGAADIQATLDYYQSVLALRAGRKN